VWDKDVRFFKVKDVETGEHIASFYLDPYSRPENKRVRMPHHGGQYVCRTTVASLEESRAIQPQDEIGQPSHFA
jgi:Zn-dependent oligopeptidase